MKRVRCLLMLLVALAPSALGRKDLHERDRGDVPGWVMVTVMSAILVVAILGIFEPQIKSALSGIFDSIRGSGN